MQRIKHIGIAALTAEGAAIVYRHICAASMRRFGGYRHPEISLHSFSLSEHLDAGPDRAKRWGSLIEASAEKLRASGADFMICPSNTPHDIYDDIADRLPLPWLHIARPVRLKAEATSARKLLLLGTRFTLESDFYDKEFRGSGISIVRPESDETARVHEIINRELIMGVVADDSREHLGQLLRRYATSGVHGVILGCTELPMIIDESLTSLALFDSAALLAEAAIERAIA